MEKYTDHRPEIKVANITLLCEELDKVMKNEGGEKLRENGLEVYIHKNKQIIIISNYSEGNTMFRNIGIRVDYRHGIEYPYPNELNPNNFLWQTHETYFGTLKEGIITEKFIGGEWIQTEIDPQAVTFNTLLEKTFNIIYKNENNGTI